MPIMMDLANLHGMFCGKADIHLHDVGLGLKHNRGLLENHKQTQKPQTMSPISVHQPHQHSPHATQFNDILPPRVRSMRIHNCSVLKIDISSSNTF